MTAVTRAAALKHLLTVVVGAAETDGPYVSIVTFHRCKTLAAFSKLTAEQLSEKFQYKKRDGTTGSVAFSTGEINDLLDLQEFIRSFKHDKNHEWMNDTAEDFIEFQETQVEEPKKGSQSTATVATSTGSTPKSYNMKRQYSDYREINKRHFFPSWEKELKITALTHNCNNPLNGKYVPTSPEEIEVFAHDQAFMMGVFIQKIKYPSGKTIISRFLSDMDAQKAYIALKSDATSEVVLQINEYKLEDYERWMQAQINGMRAWSLSWIRSSSSYRSSMTLSRHQYLTEIHRPG
jgi:hypothetical protein